MGAFVAGVIALGVGRALHRAKHALDDDFKLAKEGYHNMRRSDSMAMLVHWCYYRDLNPLEEFVAWFLEYKNDRATYYGNNHWTPHPCSERYPGELKELGLAFLRKRDDHNPNAPDLVIVLRGTIPTRVEDLEADWRIAIQRFDHTERVVRTSQMILQVVTRFLIEHPGAKICMAGHSLGAAIAQVVGGCLFSTHNIDIETHLFNPPLLTLVDFARGLPQPTAPDPYQCMMNLDFRRLKEVLVSNHAAVHREWEQFQRLQHWVPRIYLNPGDPICRQFIAFYKGREDWPIGGPGDLLSSQGLLSGLFSSNVRNFKNVVPSAKLYISTWEARPKPHARYAGPFQDVIAGRLPHSLRQWHKYTKEYINLMEHRVRLLQQPRSPERTVHPPIADYSYLFQ